MQLDSISLGLLAEWLMWVFLPVNLFWKIIPQFNHNVHINFDAGNLLKYSL